jgi:hypothetical protein
VAENICFAYDNIADAGTYSLGSWVAGLPLTNLKDYQTKKVARSTNATAANTKFLCDLGRVAPIQLLAFVRDNLSDAATVRVRVGPNTDGSSALIDTTLTAGDFGSFEAEAGRIIYYLGDDPVYARYLLVEITDTANVDGYVQLGRFYAGPVLQPDLNMQYGARSSINDTTRLVRSANRTQYADVQPKLRRLEGEFQLLTQDEGLGAVYDMQNLVGVTEPFIVLFDASLTDDNAQRLSLYCIMLNLNQLSDIAPPTDALDGDRYSWRFVVEEAP